MISTSSEHTDPKLMQAAMAEAWGLNSSTVISDQYIAVLDGEKVHMQVAHNAATGKSLVIRVGGDGSIVSVIAETPQQAAILASRL